jgi:hypothetical protein
MRFAVSGTNQGQKWVNIFHSKYSVQPQDAATVNSICQAVHTAYLNAFTTLWSSSTILNTVDGQDLASRTAATGTFSLAHPGVQTTVPMALQVALCLSWSISDRYRGGHPRTYLPGIDGTFVTGGRLLTTAGHTAYLNAAAGFLTNMNAMTAGGSSWKMCCVRYFSQHQLLANPLVREISGQSVHGRIDTQRRRLGKETP